MEKINIGELLKNCPKGTKLYSPLCGECELHMIDNDTITCSFSENLYHICFDIYDHYKIAAYKNSECLLFPSKENRDWSTFQRPFKDGDILVGKSNQPFIFKKLNNSHGCYSYCGIDSARQFKLESDDWTFANSLRLATEEEKQKLFDAIKANGYKWNAETKTLEDLVVPKFKVGDKIVNRNSISTSWIVSSVSSEYYGLTLPDGRESFGVLPISEQDSWVLVPIIPIFNVEDKIRRKGDSVLFTIKAFDYNHYIMEPINSSDGFNNCNVLEYISFNDQNDYELVPDKFDIFTLKPFESRVLVRTDNRKWVAAFYSHYDKDSVLNYCVVGGLWYEQCIPFEGNEHLLNTTNECDDYYKNW